MIYFFESNTLPVYQSHYSSVQAKGQGQGPRPSVKAKLSQGQGQAPRPRGHFRYIYILVYNYTFLFSKTCILFFNKRKHERKSKLRFNKFKKNTKVCKLFSLLLLLISSTIMRTICSCNQQTFLFVYVISK